MLHMRHMCGSMHESDNYRVQYPVYIYVVCVDVDACCASASS